MTTNKYLRIFAGSKALKKIHQNGLQANDIKYMLAASGGPKWMALFGLDQYLNKEFFSCEQTLDIIGSSAGAMRACSYAQNDAAGAIKRFADAYTATRYDTKPSAKDISDSARVLLDHLFEDDGITQIINNPNRHIHIVTTRCEGISARENQTLQALGMLKGFMLNRLSRKFLDFNFERVVFYTGKKPIHFVDNFNLRSRYLPLNKDNLYQAALASGSIPMVMEGVENIPNAPKGMYRDGGIIDYHFDLNVGEGLCLYPHFNISPRPAWFDKFGGRKIQHEHYQNTIVLAPSQSFVDSLPGKKIPDRNDFAKMSDTDRESAWRKCQQESFRLAEEFDAYLQHQNWSVIESLDALG